MEPSSAFHDFVEIKILRISLSDSAVRTVVDNFRWTHRSTCLAVIQTHAVTATNDVVLFHTVTTERVNGNLTDLMFRQFGNEISLVSIVSARDSYVCLTTTGDDTEMIRLYKTILSFGTQAEHDLAQRNNLSHRSKN